MPSILNSDDGVVSGTSGLKTTGGNDGLLNIQTNGSTAISISSGQRSTFPTTIGVGNATPSTSGSGITFPATQSASSDANTLDDYEEGTWTPSIAPSSSGSITLKGVTARYTKVGRLINVWFTAQVNTISSPVGRMGVLGLPFASSGSPTGAYAQINGFSSFTGSVGALIEASTTANIDRYASGGISADLANYAAVNGYIFFAATYDLGS